LSFGKKCCFTKIFTYVLVGLLIYEISGSLGNLFVNYFKPSHVLGNIVLTIFHKGSGTFPKFGR